MRCTARRFIPPENCCTKGLNHMPCESCSNNADYTADSVSNSNTADCSCEANACESNACNSTAGVSNCKCRLAVTVENDFAPCTLKPDYFDVTVTNRSGDLVATGKVAGGSSIILTMPCEGEYAVTVTGGVFSSPRAQTRRVRCCCGQPNGVSFIFMKLEQDCVRPRPPHHCCCPPVPRPPMPPCPPAPPCPPRPPRPPHDHPCGGVDPHDVILISEGPLEDYQ